MEEISMQSNNLVFSIVSQAIGKSIDPIDQALINREAEYEGFCLSVPADLNILRDINFFRENESRYYLVQLGEYLSFKKLELDKPFIAYTRSPIASCSLTHQPLHEMVAYKPE